MVKERKKHTRKKRISVKLLKSLFFVFCDCISIYF